VIYTSCVIIGVIIYTSCVIIGVIIYTSCVIIGVIIYTSCVIIGVIIYTSCVISIHHRNHRSTGAWGEPLSKRAFWSHTSKRACL